MVAFLVTRTIVVVAALMAVLALGIIVGVLISQNFYDYQLASPSELRTMVNTQGWEPIPNSNGPLYVRRPRFRIG